MDNITHTLVGAALAQTGLKRWTPFATTTLLLGANFPDIDIVVGLTDRFAYLEHHRGITHALIGIPLLSLLLAGLVYVGSRWWARGQTDQPSARFGPLWVMSLLSISTHPLLDFTNSYGWRPFLPWNRQWFYGDIDFVADPWLWAGLGGAVMWATAKMRWHLVAWGVLFAVLSVPILFFARSTWGIAILWFFIIGGFFLLQVRYPLPSASAQWLCRAVVIVVLLYLGALTGLQLQAVERARVDAATRVESGEAVLKVDALPLPADPFLKRIVITTDRAFYLSDFHLLFSQPASSSSARREARISGDASAIAAALREPEFQAFLRFARFPVIEAQPASDQTTEVHVRDIRFDLDSRAVSTFQTSVRLDAQMRRIVE